MSDRSVTSIRFDKQEESLARSRTYQILSSCFLYPEEDLFSSLEKGDFLEELKDSVACLLSPKSGLGQAIMVLGEKLEKLKGRTLSEMQDEYHRIFSHTISQECPPYETQYGDNENVFQQTQQLGDISGFYRAFGLEISDQTRERPDHLSLELEFMGFLIYKEASARQAQEEEKAEVCRDAQCKFLLEHLGRWTPLFAGLMRTKAGGGFYEGVVFLLEAYVAYEIAYLGVEPERVEGKPMGPLPEMCAPEGSLPHCAREAEAEWQRPG
jgi:DMSO reductase family type II enzyme chaperone